MAGARKFKVEATTVDVTVNILLNFNSYTVIIQNNTYDFSELT